MTNIVAAEEQERFDLWKRTFCKGATNDEASLFITTVKRTGLSPEARQVFAVKRWDSSEKREVMAIQVSIDGQRLIAQRSGKYLGQIGPLWCGQDGVWKDVWLEDHVPVASKVGVVHADFPEPIWGVAKFSSYVQTKKDGNPNKFWNQMPDVMIAKCAESIALRKSFPQELSGLYTAEESGEQIAKQRTVVSSQQPVIAQVTDDRKNSVVLSFSKYSINTKTLEEALGRDMNAWEESDFKLLRQWLQSLMNGVIPDILQKNRVLDV